MDEDPYLTAIRSFAEWLGITAGVWAIASSYDGDNVDTMRADVLARCGEVNRHAREVDCARVAAGESLPSGLLSHVRSVLDLAIFRVESLGAAEWSEASAVAPVRRAAWFLRKAANEPVKAVTDGLPFTETLELFAKRRLEKDLAPLSSTRSPVLTYGDGYSTIPLSADEVEEHEQFIASIDWEAVEESRRRLEVERRAEEIGAGDDRPAGPGFIFARAGGGYFISAFGEIGVVRKLKGFAILSRLLGQPGVAIRTLELHGATEGETPQELADSKAIQSAVAKRSAAAADLEDARRSNHDQGIVDAEEEIEHIDAWLKSVRGLGGKLRTQSKRNSAATSVTARIKEACKALKECTPPLRQTVEHLQQSVKIEWDESIYRPVGCSPIWTFTCPQELAEFRSGSA